MLLKVAVGGRGGNRVSTIFRAGHGPRGDHVPGDVVAAKATVFLQFAFRPQSEVAVHDAAERLPKFGLRLKLAELAFLGG